MKNLITIPAIALTALLMTGCGSSDPETTPAPETDFTSPLTDFYDTPEGEALAGVVTDVEHIGNVHKVTVTDDAAGLEACKTYQEVMTDGNTQINIVNAANEMVAITSGDPKTCDWA